MRNPNHKCSRQVATHSAAKYCAECTVSTWVTPAIGGAQANPTLRPIIVSPTRRSLRQWLCQSCENIASTTTCVYCLLCKQYSITSKFTTHQPHVRSVAAAAYYALRGSVHKQQPDRLSDHALLQHAKLVTCLRSAQKEAAPSVVIGCQAHASMVLLLLLGQ
jgi:hypothetical protein